MNSDDFNKCTIRLNLAYTFTKLFFFYCNIISNGPNGTSDILVYYHRDSDVSWRYFISTKQYGSFVFTPIPNLPRHVWLRPMTLGAANCFRFVGEKMESLSDQRSPIEQERERAIDADRSACKYVISASWLNQKHLAKPWNCRVNRELWGNYVRKWERRDGNSLCSEHHMSQMSKVSFGWKVKF